MLIFHWTAGSVLAALWLWKMVEVWVGLPKVDDITQPQWERRAEVLPRVSMVVPARNEAECIRGCLTSLLNLDYPDLEVIAIDDRSTDATGKIMDDVAAASRGRLRVVHATELPAGWLGKTHAMWKGASLALGEWILFTDGDVVFQPDALRRAVNYAEETRADHLVLLPTMVMKTWGERMMISYFINNLVFIHRLWKVSDPDARDFTGAGAFNMIRKSAYEKVGTYEAMRLEIVDDLALGKAVKDRRLAQCVAIGEGLISLRWAIGAMGVVRNLTKNVFALMRYNWAISLGAAIGAAFAGLGPLLGAIFAPGVAKIPFAVALVSMAMIYVMMVKVTQVSPVYFFTHPLACVLVIYTLVRSTFVTLWDGGVTWRGTKYSLDELRAGFEETQKLTAETSEKAD